MRPVRPAHGARSPLARRSPARARRVGGQPVFPLRRRREFKRERPPREKGRTMKLTTTTQVSVDGVMQGPGGPDEDERGGFERGGWAMPYFDDEAMTAMEEIYQRAGAFLFGRR